MLMSINKIKFYNLKTAYDKFFNTNFNILLV